VDTNEFKATVEGALKNIREGLDALVEVDELIRALPHVAHADDKVSMIKELAAKEKAAVSLIEQSTLQTRTLLKASHDSIERLMSGI